MEHNNKINLRKIRHENIEWNEVVPDKIWWQHFVKCEYGVEITDCIKWRFILAR
jgi:hypothetical protein